MWNASYRSRELDKQNTSSSIDKICYRSVKFLGILLISGIKALGKGSGTEYKVRNVAKVRKYLNVAYSKYGVSKGVPLNIEGISRYFKFRTDFRIFK